MGVEHIDWESCSVLDKKEESFSRRADKVYECILIYCSDRTIQDCIYER